MACLQKFPHVALWQVSMQHISGLWKQGSHTKQGFRKDELLPDEGEGHRSECGSDHSNRKFRLRNHNYARGLMVAVSVGVVVAVSVGVMVAVSVGVMVAVSVGVVVAVSVGVMAAVSVGVVVAVSVGVMAAVSVSVVR